MLTEDMQHVVREQRLGFHATVCDDGTPNLSPKGTTDVWDDDHLFFAEICSPQTVENIQRGSTVEVNVVDPFVRKGYRLSGPAVWRWRPQPVGGASSQAVISGRRPGRSMKIVPSGS
jgi:predicted pyridoxine 5'-phosphate oxidase superfamily flavin-nucleotide-binding protein